MKARQSTARTFMVGPVLDADGVAVTGGVVADFKCSKNGAAPGALDGSATLTHRHTGFYSLALTANDLDTVGTAQITIDDTVNACPMLTIQVVEEVVYDALFAASSNAFTGAAGSTKVTGVVLTDTVTTLTNLPAITANWLTAAGIAAGALNGKGDWNIGKTGYALSAAGIQAIWDALTSALTTAGSIGKLLVDNINATMSSRASQTSVDTIDDLLDTEVAAIKSDTAAILLDTDSLDTTKITTARAAKLDEITAARMGALTDWIDGGRLDLLLDTVVADNPNIPTRGVQLSNLMLMMVDATDLNTPETGVTVTATISKDGGAFAACTNAVSEVSGGWYKITLTATEMTADSIAVKFTGTGCAQRNIHFRTQPT